jgi:hypothetical protein
MQFNAATATLSVALAVYESKAVGWPLSVTPVWLDGQILTGGSVSFTVTVNVQEATFSDESVVEQVTTVGTATG